MVFVCDKKQSCDALRESEAARQLGWNEANELRQQVSRLRELWAATRISCSGCALSPYAGAKCLAAAGGCERARYAQEHDGLDPTDSQALVISAAQKGGRSGE